MAETRRPQGEILVEMGAVSPDDVARMLADQQASYFGLIAALDAGRFAFDAAAPVPEWTVGSRLSPVRTIVEALERPQANALVAGALQPAASVGARLASGYGQASASFRWSDAERALVARLERGSTLEAFFAPSAVSPERARAILAGLLLLGLAVPAGKDADGEATGSFSLTPPPMPLAPAVPAAPAAPARRSDPAEARARRHRLLQQAMRNMGVGPFGARGAEAGAGRPETPRPTPGPAPTPSPVAGTASEEELRKALLAVAPRARERDFFARLGLEHTAGREDAKKAFLAIAKQFHPDRFASPALADLQDLVRDFFASVNEAYEVLSNDRKRIEYLNQRASGDRDRALAAKVDFEKGEACLRTRDLGRARGFLESALRADPLPLYQAALAHAYVADPTQKDRARARALLADACRDPTCDRAFFVAGIIARDEGDDVAAERSFRAAVKANPRNADATRELRIVEGRRAEKRR
jgi:tetratricopeptide (TPR) repeat protein